MNYGDQVAQGLLSTYFLSTYFVCVRYLQLSKTLSNNLKLKHPMITTLQAATIPQPQIDLSTTVIS